MKTVLALAASTLLLVGCAADRMASLPPEQLAAVPDDQLLSAYTDADYESLKAEVKRRKLLSDEEWSLVQNRQIKMGMREQVLWLSWGRPERVNEDVTPQGRSRQLGYNCDTYGLCHTYVYVDGGVVTSWQKLGR